MCFAISSDSELNQVNELLEEWTDISAAYVPLNWKSFPSQKIQNDNISGMTSMKH